MFSILCLTAVFALTSNFKIFIRAEIKNEFYTVAEHCNPCAIKNKILARFHTKHVQRCAMFCQENRICGSYEFNSNIGECGWTLVFTTSKWRCNYNVQSAVL